MPTVAIGIQARSDSERLPNKINMEILGKTCLQYVIDAAQGASSYLNRRKTVNKVGTPYDTCNASVHLLMPENDKSKKIYGHFFNIISVENDNDVLGRYMKLYDTTNCDYLVRLTGDCLHLPTHMISRAIKTAIIKNADYVSNIIHRTSPEGFDVEVISPKMLNFLNEMTATDLFLREHVSLFLVNDIKTRPLFYKSHFKIWHLYEHYDFSGIKTSLDIQKEYDISKRNMESVRNKKNEGLKSGYISE